MRTRMHTCAGIFLTSALLGTGLVGACSDDTPSGENDAAAGADGGRSDAAVDGSIGETDGGRAPRDGATPDDGAQDDPADGEVEAPACDTTSAPAVPALSVDAVVPSSAGLTRIVNAAQAPGSDDWYLVQQTGTVRVFSNGALLPDPFLDVSDDARVMSQDDERGLLGLAFPPDYADTQLFYVAITVTSDNHDEVREYKVVDGGAELQRRLLTLPPSAGNHNGGTVAFGPDGLLYVGTGDGGGGCDNNQPDAPQAPSSLFGKIHRLDPKKTAAPYAADGNPYPNAPTVLHIGFRNPFRFSIDAPSRTLFIGDVGQDQYEELDAISLDTLGKNFGWAAYEGNEMTCSGRGLGEQKEWERPIFVADRRAGSQCQAGTPFCDWKSALGGVVYRGSAIPALLGVHIFGDYVGRRMVALTHCNGQTSDFTVINKVCDPNDPSEACLEGSELDALTAIVRDHEGEVYLVADGSQLLKVVPGS